jgi:predicted ATPase
MGLPVAQSSFIGREQELTELAALLARSRLVSLVGPGGAGKTRLAIEAIRMGPATSVAYLSPATVERHLATVYSKIGVSGRVEAARYAIAHGLASPSR